MPITLHLGTYKTATTSLQRLLKNKKGHLTTLGYDIYAGTFDRKKAIMRRHFHPYLTDKMSRKEFLFNFEKIFLNGPNNHKVISEEMLLGPIGKGPSLYGDNIRKVTSALDDLKEPYKIVFVTRRIDSLLESFYIHNLAVGFTTKSFADFYAALAFEMSHWSNVLNEFENGKNLLELSVIPFEICLSDASYYVQAVMSALGLPHLEWGSLPRENRSIGKKGCSVIWDLNANTTITDEDRNQIKILITQHFLNVDDAKPDFFGKFRKILLHYHHADMEEIAKRYFKNIPDQYLTKIYG